VVSYLPMAHVAERNVSHYLPMLLGFTVTCCPDAREVMKYLPEVKPTWFFAVPRIWEKLKAGLEGMVEGLDDEEQKNRIKGAMDTGLRRVKAIQAGEKVPDELEQEWEEADREVLSDVRQMLGLNDIEACNVGAAPTPPEVIEFFHALGVPLAELWGMSETTGAGTCNPPEKIKIGTVGPAAPGVEIKLAEDGEVLVKGPVVMPGYRNNPEKTKETFTDDGYLLTGDIGELDEDGYLTIVDRKKELIINAAGKNMSPANIESELKSAGPLIGQAVTIGDGRSYNVALLTLDPDAVPALVREHGIDDDSLDKLVEDERVVEAVQKELDAANEQLARVEQLKKFKLLPTDWEPGGDELTPTMKLKRKPIAEKYAEEIEALYAK
jgi:long-chain acyl-CoA synthetase